MLTGFLPTQGLRKTLVKAPSNCRSGYFAGLSLVVNGHIGERGLIDLDVLALRAKALGVRLDPRHHLATENIATGIALGRHGHNLG